MKGLFISFEGIEGTGKTTQVKNLADYLRGKGYRVTQTEEPGGTPISRKIRELLLSPDSEGMDPVTELLLYNASRVQHINEVIVPALTSGEIVVTDRFCDSTVAYQGYGRGINLDIIDSLDKISTGGLRPDVTLLLDIEVEAGLRRNREIHKSDRLEKEDISFHQKVREGFQKIAEREPERMHIVDCSGTIESVKKTVVNIIDRFLDRGKYQ